MVDYEQHDELVSTALVNSTYNWAMAQDFYCNHTNLPPLKWRPNVHGNNNAAHYGQIDPDGNIKDQINTTMYRVPVGWDDESCERVSLPMWELWCSLNEKLFEGKAKLSGAGEGISGVNINRGRVKEDWEKFGLNNIHELGRINKKGWTSFVNARYTPNTLTPGITDNNGKSLGHIHKDTRPEFKNKNGRFVTVLCNLNMIWEPAWAGELILFNEQGWPEVVIPHVPGKVVVFDHMTTHKTLRPYHTAPQMAFKAAFRVEIL